VASQARECINPQCAYQGQHYTSAAVQMITVPKCTYGLDVIAQIGWWRDKEHLNREQIHTRLRERGVQICEREVDHLYARYQVLMGCAERLEAERLEKVAKEYEIVSDGTRRDDRVPWLELKEIRSISKTGLDSC